MRQSGCLLQQRRRRWRTLEKCSAYGRWNFLVIHYPLFLFCSSGYRPPMLVFGTAMSSLPRGVYRTTDRGGLLPGVKPAAASSGDAAHSSGISPQGDWRRCTFAAPPRPAHFCCRTFSTNTFRHSLLQCMPAQVSAESPGHGGGGAKCSPPPPVPDEGSPSIARGCVRIFLCARVASIADLEPALFGQRIAQLFLPLSSARFRRRKRGTRICARRESRLLAGSPALKSFGI